MTAPPSPILPEQSNVVWAIAPAVITLVVLVVLAGVVIRWAGWHLGFQLGRFRRFRG